MPMLNCSAFTCVYNKDELCSKGDIMVGGTQATDAVETCCESFRERTSSDESNTCGCGNRTIHVDCEACRCIYNEDRRCDAAKVDIGGNSAQNPRETMCGTFRCDCQ